MASIGAQAIWIFVTWLFWIVGAGILNSAASSFLVNGATCGPGGVVYCSQIRALFGELHIFIIIRISTVLSIYSWLGVAVVERCIFIIRGREVPVTNVACPLSFMLSGGMLAMLWLAWQSARYIFEPASFQMKWIVVSSLTFVSILYDLKYSAKWLHIYTSIKINFQKDFNVKSFIN